MPDDHIFDIAEDQNGNIWLATDHGVVKYDGTDFQSYTTADGLPGNSIHAIIIGINNDVWCGTSYGVGYYNGKTWQSFSTIDGLAGDLVTNSKRKVWRYLVLLSVWRDKPLCSVKVKSKRTGVDSVNNCP